MATPHSSAAGLLSLQALFLERGRIERAQLAPLTQTGYANDWRAFSRWTKARDLASLPSNVETVTLFATDFLARGRKTTTVRRLVAGVNYMHRQGSHPVEWNEQIDDLIAGARRLRPQAIKQAKPLKIEDLRAISARLEAAGSPRAIRNRALLVVGFCAALRSASLSDLQLGDVEFEPRGAVLTLRREKNDQLGYGREIGLPFGKHPETCPVRTLRSWIEIRTSFPGPLFTHIREGHGSHHSLSNEAISTLLQSGLRRIGVDPAGYSSHSMRSGMVTAAGENNISELIIARTTGHRDLKMVRRYFRRRDAFHTSLSSLLDL